MKNFLKESFLLLIAGIIINISCLIMFPFSVHAEDEPEYPMIIDFAKNPADTTLEEIQNAFSIMWGDLPESYVIYCAVKDQIYVNGSHGWDYYDYYQYTISVNPVFDYPLELSVTSPYYYITNGVEYYFDYIPDIDHWGSYNSATNIRHQYAYSYMAQGLGWILYGTEDEYTSIQDVVVWAHRHSGPVINTGAAIIPPEPIFPEFLNGETPPVNVPPTYNSTDYTWTTPPSFDGSSVEAALGSIQNIIGWLSNNLKEEFKNLTDNLEGFFKYIGQTIQYYAGIIIETLNNFIQNFYDNMKSLVQPIFEKIDYITQPIEASVIWDNISGTSLISNFNTISASATALKGSFNNLSEPNSYTIPIHLENLPSSMFGTLTTQYIDLSVINPVKSLIRVFMWALITYSLAITIFDSIANYINGGGDES